MSPSSRRKLAAAWRFQDEIGIDIPVHGEFERNDMVEYFGERLDGFTFTANGWVQSYGTRCVKDETQIHTGMCYSEFNDIISSIAALDADVITIETSRSNMELLDAFVDFNYPNEIGPGVYDIHSPRVPSVEEMANLMSKAEALIPAENLWVNPDCGLKTRGWPEVRTALANMVTCAKTLRERSTANIH